MATSRAAEFSIPQARRNIHDLFVHRPLIYWADFLITISIGYGAAMAYLNAPLLSIQQIVCYFIAGFALFRLGSFIHEMVHLRKGEMTGFSVAWNILAGIPMLMPSFFYENHIDHHNTHHYGTGQDGEYLPLGSSSLSHILKFFSQVLFMPVFVSVRFGVLTPMSFLHPKLRIWTLERWSSFVINWRYRRRYIPEDSPRGWWAFLEWACCLRTWAIFIFVFAGLAPWQRIPLLYLLAAMTLGLNYVRNLVAHHYLGRGESMTHAEQLLDSVNITGGFATELFFPLGLRFHALHHLFPSLPYHNLCKAHNRLMATLPADSPYRDTVFPSYIAVLKVLLANAGKSQHDQHAAAREWFQRREQMFAGRGV